MQEKQPENQSATIISTPQDMNKYLRVSTPSTWFILGAIFLLLVGALVWGIWGRMETTNQISVLAQDGVNISYIRADVRSSVKSGSIVRIESKQYHVTDISPDPIQSDSLPNKVLSAGNYALDTWVYQITLDGNALEDIQSGEIVLESIAPISFLLNNQEEEQ